MLSIDDAHYEVTGLPEMLTVAEAARVLRIGRTLAYELASKFLEGDPTGIPVIRLGSCLRVPPWALDELIHHGRVISDLASGLMPTSDEDVRRLSTRPTHSAGSRTRRAAMRSSAQLSLLDGH